MLGLASCHRNRLSKSTNKVVIDSSSLGAVITPAKIQEVAFDYLTAKSKFSFNGKNQDFDNTNVNIRMKKDSLIWISVTGIGFEVARGLITPDSIVFMDKIHKDYFVFNYAQLSRQYNFKLDFPLLQSIIIGNLPFEPESDAKLTREGEFFVLKQNKEKISIENYIGTNNLKLTKLNANETGTSNKFSLDYQDFKEVSNFLFPFTSLVKLNVKSPKDQQLSETTIRLKHNKVELVNQSPGFPFSIPSSYKRKR